jgi:lysophospholipid acyltransferase (LPLAT)-like uncharacterized protein
MRVAGAGVQLVRDDTARVETLIEKHGPLMVCFWHGRLLSMFACWQGVRVDILMSGSRDGRMMAKSARYFGYGNIEGSAARPGRNKRTLEGAHEVVERLRAGTTVAITPDGPRGPRMHAGIGAVLLAQLGAVDILPISASLSPSWRVNSWDRMIVPYPKPGARGALVAGELISVPQDAKRSGREAARLEMERQLNLLSAEADEIVGAPVVLPAEPAAA